MSAYYNEIDPYAAQWLRNLIAEGHIAPGDVDERDIRDINPAELSKYTQCHFFAGIGVWSHSLRQAGWPDDRPVWTGSCPCQPFSAAGRGGGTADERHLWPHWHHLISECRPPRVFGEQVASKDGLGWLDLVSSDLQGTGYAAWAVDLCAAGVGAPHIRQRLFFVAEDERAPYASNVGCNGGAALCHSGSPEQRRHIATNRDGSSRMAYDHGGNTRAEGEQPRGQYGQQQANGSTGGRSGGPERDREIQSQRLADPDGRSVSVSGRVAQIRDGERSDSEDLDGSAGRPGPTNGLWGNADWLFCRDGKWRPVESGTFPLAHGAPERMGRLRAYGNAIVSQVAITFIETYLEGESHARRASMIGHNSCASNIDLADLL